MKKIKVVVIVSGMLISLYANQTIELVQGWNLVGTYVEDTNLTILDKNYINSAWKFDTINNSWKAYSSNTTTSKSFEESGMEKITSLKSGEGFWINSTSPETLEIVGYPAKIQTEVLNGWNLLASTTNTPLDASNIKNIWFAWKWNAESQKWSAYSSDKYLQDKIATFASKGKITTFDQIVPGEGFWVQESFDTNSSSSSVAVLDATNILKNINVEQDNIEKKIEQARDILKIIPKTDNSAKVAWALLDFADIANNECISSVFDFSNNTNSINYDKILPNIIFSTLSSYKIMNLKSKPIDFTNCTKTVLNSAADRLKIISDKLSAVYSSNPYFIFTQDDMNLTKPNADVMRSTALLAASQLKYIVAHNFGIYSGDIDEVTTDTGSYTITYRPIDIDPAYSWMSSYYFFAYNHSKDGIAYDYDTNGDGDPDGYQGISLSDSQANLDSFKKYLLESATIASKLNPADFDTDDQQDIDRTRTIASDILANINNGDSVELNGKKSSMSSIVIDLRPLFNVSTSIDAFDFAVDGKFKYDCEYSKSLSILRNDATCSDETPANIIPREVPTALKSNLDNVVKKYTEDGKIYTGDELIMKIAGGFDYIAYGYGWRETSWDGRYWGNYTYQDATSLVLVANQKGLREGTNGDSRVQLETNFASNPATKLEVEFTPTVFTPNHSSPRFEIKAEKSFPKYRFQVQTSLKVKGDRDTVHTYVCYTPWGGVNSTEMCIDYDFNLSENITEGNDYKISIETKNNEYIYKVFNASNTTIGQGNYSFNDVNDTVKEFFDSLYDPDNSGDTPSVSNFDKVTLRALNENADVNQSNGSYTEVKVKDVTITHP